MGPHRTTWDPTGPHQAEVHALAAHGTSRLLSAGADAVIRVWSAPQLQVGIPVTNRALLTNSMTSPNERIYKGRSLAAALRSSMGLVNDINLYK